MRVCVERRRVELLVRHRLLAHQRKIYTLTPRAWGQRLYFGHLESIVSESVRGQSGRLRYTGFAEGKLIWTQESIGVNEKNSLVPSSAAAVFDRLGVGATVKR